MAKTPEEKLPPSSGSAPFPGMPFQSPFGMAMPPMPPGMIPGPPGGPYSMMPPPPPGGMMPPGAMSSPVSASSVFDSLGTMLKLGIDTVNAVLAGGNQLLQGISGSGYYPGHYPAAPHPGMGYHGYGHHGHHCCEHNHYHDSYGHSCCDVCGDSCCHPSVHNCG
jgi:hypothetical protein